MLSTESKYCILILLLGIALASELALADGGIFVDTHSLVYEPSQKAAIIWNDNGTETLILSTKIQTNNTTNLAWLIPVTSKTKPEVKAGNISIFYSLADIFATHKGLDEYLCPAIFVALLILLVSDIILLIKGKIGFFVLVFTILIVVLFLSLFYLGTFNLGSGLEAGVQPIEIKKVDIYDIAILKATNATDLVKWLNGNGYIVPENATSILQEYCNEGNFYFIANKINLTNVYNTSSDIEAAKAQLSEGVATPLEITFQPDTPFYPMRISSINEGYSNIEIYVISKTPRVDNSRIIEAWRSMPVGGALGGEYSDYNVVLFKGWVDLKSLTNDSVFIEALPYCNFPSETHILCYPQSLATINSKTSELKLLIDPEPPRKIKVTGVVCTQKETQPPSINNYEANPLVIDNREGYVEVPISEPNTSHVVRCTDANGNLLSNTSVGAVYNGIVYINYTEQDTGISTIFAGRIKIRFGG